MEEATSPEGRTGPLPPDADEDEVRGTISDFDPAKTEDLWDEETDQVVRAFFFEQGTWSTSDAGTARSIRGIHTNQFPSTCCFRFTTW